MDNQFSLPVETPVIQTSMDFPDAIKEVTKGNKIARVSWNNTDYGFLAQDGWLSIYRNGENFVWKINDGDLKGTDWVIIK